MRRFVVAEGSLRVGSIELESDVASHVRDVIGLTLGDQVQLSDGAGASAVGAIAAISRRGVSVAISEVNVLPAPEGMALVLIPCVAKGDKIDGVVRQACELGVRAILPVISERSVGEKRGRVERWRAIAEDAIRVSGRSHRPQIAEVQTFGELIARPRAEASYVFALEAAQSFKQILSARASVPKTMELLIGPEGGLTEAEVAAARDAGFTAVHLGPHTLRAETAGPAIAAMALFWAGS